MSCTVMMDAETCFLDTNVLVYASDPQSPFYAAARMAIVQREQRTVQMVISNQVIREYYTVMTRPTPDGSPDQQAVVQNIATFTRLYTIADDNLLVRESLLMLTRTVVIGGRQIYDANIVATMLAYGIPVLLTNNVAHFTRFAEFITVLPLLS